ncbi:MAG: PASTA domain-containing protein [bacterium]|nr:PASTA domain-containing protein [bacterium]
MTTRRMTVIRVAALMLTAGAVFSGLVGRLYFLQVIHADETRANSERARVYTKELPPVRGDILDRNGRVLAQNEWKYTVMADKERMDDPASVIAKAGEVLGLTQEDIDRHVESTIGVRGRVLAHGVSEKMKSKLEAMQLPGIFFDQTDTRFYPEGPLAGQMLGYTGRDNRGLEGLELSLNEWLEGAAKEIIAEKDPRRKLLASEDYTKFNTQGPDAILTIDGYIQYIVERELEKVLAETEANQVNAVVMDAETGDVLALANAPRMDPNHYEDYPQLVRKNRLIANMFEPGSVIKPFTVLAALSEGRVTPDTVFFCENGRFYFKGRTIRDDIHSFGNLTVHDILVRSSNIGTVKIAQSLTTDSSDWRGQAEILYKYLRAFGFKNYEKSTYDLPGEQGGVLRKPSDWQPASIGAVPYGQEMSTNTLILTTAYNALANRGVFRPARIVMGFQGKDGVFLEREPETPYRVADAGVAEQVIRMMVDVTEDPEGTGDKVRIPGFHIAGKTGTAQKYDPETGTYGRGMRIASFCGFFPAEKPRVTISVVVDQPRHGKYGGALAGPVWKAIAEEIVAYWGMAPTVHDDPLLAEQAKELAQAEAERNEKEESAFGIKRVLPAPAFAFDANAAVMPDLTGLPLRDAYIQLRRLGLGVEVEGSGKVVSQEPIAGAAIAAASREASIQCEPVLIDPTLQEPAPWVAQAAN